MALAPWSCQLNHSQEPALSRCQEVFRLAWLLRFAKQLLPLRMTAGGIRPIRGFVPWYTGTMKPDASILVERVQTGVRLEKRLLKVLKAFAEYHDLTLGDLLEGIVLHAFDGKTPFTQASLNRIKDLKTFYGLELDSRASHRLKEDERKRRPSR
jgi:hypothetical protein